jgi:glycosyltransferase involved in cell wall biosynthesis
LTPNRVFDPSIAVIIPVFNRLDELRRALSSIAEQTVKPHEVVVCDDGSSDDLVQVVNEFLDLLLIKYIRIDNTGGPSVPRNVAANNTDCEWLAFLDSDDKWHKEKIERTKNYLKDNVDVVYHRMSVVGASNFLGQGVTIGERMTTSSSAAFDFLSRGNPIPTSASVVRRSLYLTLNGMRRDSEVVEDYDFWIRAALSGGRFRFINDTLGEYFVTNESLSSSFIRQAALINNTIMKYEQAFSNRELLKIQSYRNFSVAVQLIKAKCLSEALIHLKMAGHLSTLRQRLSCYLKYLYIFCLKSI